ncbi:putative 2-(5''-triphosphoribosyl)-3'-dephosphocoenzyme-A synthase [Streptomyces spinoverrucosus]|uniref:triphosphoribosyl-dephospho-CoA synthase n=1 Tax=Streptomyces spinoverrucosus TaxID=284043 RepID=A0A4Y3VP19_9ACTN|nr:triphosphoribosyl-dephospho-CoA synthase [Streptomyces spinoverrucosus]GEC07511.1 putative 2-(5''-triphosphoribosyl)-3'-dephosphocoenzyme-A synthase [Streptomyces spinoverrucosus]GHB63783.1 putative 2-(5''-triphosphoribosyl)-3'-dephosphocoenzyme-A synthase [Streptomyces spinoverrucosus]
MTRRHDEALAQAAVDALTVQLALAPKPGLPDPRDLAARTTGRDHRSLRWSAKALAPGLAAMAASARRTGAPTPHLRAELGAIGRGTEHSVALAGGGHRGALWTLGLLVAASALTQGAGAREVMAAAKRIAAHPDRRAPLRPSRGSTVSAKYGAAGARGEARAGFPHLRRALDALTVSRSAGATEPQARLDALLTVMSTLQDTELLHTAGPLGLRHVQEGARRVLDAGGTATKAGAEALESLDADLQAREWSPRGSAALLAGALFLDARQGREELRDQPQRTRRPQRWPNTHLVSGHHPHLTP